MEQYKVQRVVGDPNLKDKPLRVLLWAPKGSGLHYGGPGMSAFHMYGTATDHHIEVSLCHGYAEQEPYPEVFANVHRLSTLFDDSMSSVGARVTARLLQAGRYYRYISLGKRWLQENRNRFDVFHGLTGFHFTMKPAVYAEDAGIPAVVKLAAYRADIADKGGFRSLLGLPRRRREMLLRISGVIAISSGIRDELLNYGVPESKIALIPNGVDMSKFYPAGSEELKRVARMQLGLPDRPTVLFVGGVIPRKQPHLLVEALGELNKRGLDAQLVIVGPIHDAGYYKSICAMIDGLGLSSSVICTGYTTRTPEYYRAADVFCLPSKNEGMANALLEAMATRLPTVVTPISGSVDLVDEESGTFASSLREVVEAVHGYLTDPALASAHGAAGYSRIVQSYSSTAVLNAHVRLFRRIMAGEPAAE